LACLSMMLQLMLLYSSKVLFVQFGRTENVKNCLSPQFSRSFELDYYFEEVQNLRFAVYDIDNKTPQVSDDDFLGQIECTLGEVRIVLFAPLLPLF